MAEAWEKKSDIYLTPRMTVQVSLHVQIMLDGKL